MTVPTPSDECRRCRHGRWLHGGPERAFGCYAFPCAVGWRMVLGLRSRCPVFVEWERSPTPVENCANRLPGCAGRSPHTHGFVWRFP
jgi:hypothetical protein